MHIAKIGMAIGVSFFLFFSSFYSCGYEPFSELTEINKDKNEKISFIVIGDAGTGNENQMRVATALHSWCQKPGIGCDFALFAGDIFYNSGLSDDPNEAEYVWNERFATPYSGLQFPFYMAMGNHDYSWHGVGKPNWDKKEIYKRFHKKSGEGDSFAGKWQFPHSWYSFSAGNAMFMALDTQHLIYGRELDAHQDLVSQAVMESKQKGLDFNIAFGHHPIYSNGKHGNAGNYGNGISKLFEQKDGKLLKRFYQSYVDLDRQLCDGVDIFIAGHDHNLQMIHKTENQCPGLYLISGVGGKMSKLVRKEPGEIEDATLWQAETLGFMHIEIEDTLLTVRMVNAEAQELEAIQCNKLEQTGKKFNCWTL